MGVSSIAQRILTLLIFCSGVIEASESPSVLTQSGLLREGFAQGYFISGGQQSLKDVQLWLGEHSEHSFEEFFGELKHPSDKALDVLRNVLFHDNDMLYALDPTTGLPPAATIMMAYLNATGEEKERHKVLFAYLLDAGTNVIQGLQHSQPYVFQESDLDDLKKVYEDHVVVTCGWPKEDMWKEILKQLQESQPALYYRFLPFRFYAGLQHPTRGTAAFLMGLMNEKRRVWMRYERDPFLNLTPAATALMAYPGASSEEKQEYRELFKELVGVDLEDLKPLYGSAPLARWEQQLETILEGRRERGDQERGDGEQCPEPGSTAYYRRQFVEDEKIRATQKPDRWETIVEKVKERNEPQLKRLRFFAELQKPRTGSYEFLTSLFEEDDSLMYVRDPFTGCVPWTTILYAYASASQEAQTEYRKLFNYLINEGIDFADDQQRIAFLMDADNNDLQAIYVRLINQSEWEAILGLVKKSTAQSNRLKSIRFFAELQYPRRGSYEYVKQMFLDDAHMRYAWNPLLKLPITAGVIASYASASQEGKAEYRKIFAYLVGSSVDCLQGLNNQTVPFTEGDVAELKAIYLQHADEHAPSWDMLAKKLRGEQVQIAPDKKQESGWKNTLLLGVGALMTYAAYRLLSKDTSGKRETERAPHYAAAMTQGGLYE